MEIKIRKATASDYDPLCDLFDEIDTLHRDRLPHIFQKPNGPAREKDYYLESLANENAGFFIAEVGVELVGLIYGKVKEMPDNPLLVPHRCVVVDTIVVKLGFQNQGVGKILMSMIQEWAVTRGATAIELGVYEFNENAITFYEKLGYQTLSRRMRKEFESNKPHKENLERANVKGKKKK